MHMIQFIEVVRSLLQNTEKSLSVSQFEQINKWNDANSKTILKYFLSLVSNLKQVTTSLISDTPIG